MAIRRATPSQVIRIGALLAEHFDHEAGQYRNDLDDRAIAEEVDKTLSPSTVANVRKSLGMHFKAYSGRHTTIGQVAKLTEDLTELQKALSAQATELQRLRWVILELAGPKQGPLLMAKAKQQLPFKD